MLLKKTAAKPFLERLGVDWIALWYVTAPLHIRHAEQGLRCPAGIIWAAELCPQLANYVNKRLSSKSSQVPPLEASPSRSASL